MESLNLWKNDWISRSSNQSSYNWEAHTLISSSSPKRQWCISLLPKWDHILCGQGSLRVDIPGKCNLSAHSHSAVCGLSSRIRSDLSGFSELPRGAAERWVRRQAMMNSCGLMSKLEGCSYWPRSHTDAFSLLGTYGILKGIWLGGKCPPWMGRGAAGSGFWRQGCTCAGEQVKPQGLEGLASEES